MQKIQACIFDLDGVIVDTAKYHYAAWKKLANQLGFDFSEKENEQLKGVSRIDSLKLILKWGKVEKSEKEMLELASKKNSWYLDFVQKMDESEILPGVLSFLKALEESGIPIALGSASKNAGFILERIGLHSTFKVVVDGNSVEKGKPDPEVFLKGASALGVSPAHCVVFEDAEKGIDAALRGGMLAIGVGSPKNLGHAHAVISGFQDFSLEQLYQIPRTKSIKS